MLSDERYLKGEYGTDLVVMSIRKVFEIFFADDNLAGIIINPSTEAEIILQRQIIEMLELKIIKNLRKI